MLFDYLSEKHNVSFEVLNGAFNQFLFSAFLSFKVGLTMHLPKRPNKTSFNKFQIAHNSLNGQRKFSQCFRKSYLYITSFTSTLHINSMPFVWDHSVNKKVALKLCQHFP